MQSAAPFQTIASLGQSLGAAIEQHLDTAFRKLMHGSQVVSEPGFVRLLTGEPHPLGNLAVVSDPANLECTTAAVAPLASGDVPAAVLFSGVAGQAVKDYLRTQQFESHGVMPAMAVEINELSETKLPAGYEFSRIRGEQAKDWARAFGIGYELPPAVAEAFSPQPDTIDLSPEAPIQVFAIFRNAAIVATSLLFLDAGLAGVYCVATIPDERGKGLGAYVTAQPLRLVHEIGYRVGVLQSSPAGHSVYRRLGFADFGGLPFYVRMPA